MLSANNDSFCGAAKMLTLLMTLSLMACPKPAAPAAPSVGWHREEGWKGDCYYPPNFEGMGETDRRIARQKALEEMKAQWSGARNDGVSFAAEDIETLEIVLLGRPKLIESVAATNLEQCKGVMAGGDAGSWGSWVRSMPAKLTAGECPTPPLDYTLYDYLDINTGWQRPIGLCKGNRAQIIASVKDRYRISDNGPWITVDGDKSLSAIGKSDLPCNIEGCFQGQLVGKFETADGVVTIFPIGAEKVFEAPEHGTLTLSINDTTWFDNKWFKTAAIEDHTSVTVQPAK